jgi:hypothetical protein
MPKDKIILSLQSNLAKPNSNTAKKDIIQHFGLDEPTGMGDISPIPKPKDFLEFPFRVLSAELVGSGTWKSTDFRNEAVLRQALAMFAKKPCYFNHSQDASRVVGVSGNPKWANSYVAENGVIIPAGIDVPFVIDSVLFPALCRMLNSPDSPIQCCSVAIEFEYQPSHTFENPNDFLYHVGESINGEEVTRIVTKIIAVSEISFVHEGAAPHSRKLGEDGKLATMPFNAATDNEKQAYETNHTYSVATEFKGTLQFQKAKETAMKVLLHKNGVNETVELEKWNETYLAVDKTLFEQLQADQKALTALKKEKEDLVKEVQQLTAVKEDLIKQLVPLNNLTKTAREKAKNLYTVFMKNKPSELILANIEKANLDEVQEYIKTFGGAVSEEFGSGVCKKCGSKEVEFRSTEPTSIEQIKDLPTNQPNVDLTKFNR